MALTLSFTTLMGALVSAPGADAAQSLAQVQAKVRQLEEEATTAAEGAQEAKVKLASLTRTLNGIQAQEKVQGASVQSLSKSLNAELKVASFVLITPKSLITKLLVLILAVIASKGLFSTVINSLTTAATSIEAVPLELAELVDVTMMNLPI